MLEILKISFTIIGGILIVWYWNKKKHELDRYSYLSDAYLEVLHMYRDSPRFGDSNSTKEYQEHFRNEELLEYQFFAMSVHNTMESIYDFYGHNIPDEWIHLFRYHTKLHLIWLNENKSSYRPSYIDYVNRQDERYFRA